MNRTIVIAEAGVNHNGDLGNAKKLIEVAAYAGADYVKFQTFSARDLATQDARQANYQIINTGLEESQYQMLSRLELKREYYCHLIEHSRECGIKFLSTAFDIDSLKFLDGLGLDLVKISSGDITNYPFLCAVSELKKPVVLSTGMASLGEVEAAVNLLIGRGVKPSELTLLHCTTEYPAPPEEVNLRAIETLRIAFGVSVGYSDHTAGIEVPIAAVSLGASLIEKHFTLDCSMQGPDHLASLEPKELVKLVSSIRLIEKTLGDGIKRAMPSEISNIVVARRSIVAKCDIKAGEKFTKENLCMKRPGTGISPMRYEEILGRVAKKDFYTDQQIEI